MDQARFDSLAREIGSSGARRTLLGGLALGALGALGWETGNIAHEGLAAGRCRDGQRQCHGKCCPRRGPVCCKNWCCKKGYRCCGNHSCCQK